MYRSLALVFAVALLGCGKAPSNQASVDSGPAITSAPARTGPTAPSSRASTRLAMTRPASPPTQPIPKPKAPVVEEDPAVLAAFTAKKWKFGLEQQLGDPEPLVYLTLPSGPLSEADAAIVGKSRALQAIHASGTEMTDAALKAALAAPLLQKVTLWGTNLSDAGLAHLGAASGLSDVTLYSPLKVTAAGQAELAKLKKLRELKLSRAQVDDRFFAALGRCDALRELELLDLTGMTDQGAKSLAQYPTLEVLRFSVASNATNALTAAGIRAIAEGRLPPEFKFDIKLIDDKLLSALLAHGWLFGPTPAGKVGTKPATAEGVTSVDLRESRVTDEGVNSLSMCTKLESIYLDGTGITDATLQRLAGFPKLKLLTLGKCKITAAGLEALNQLPIESLDLSGCELSEDAFKAVGKLSRLTGLSLNAAKFEAKWFSHLSGLNKLMFLSASYSPFDDVAAKVVGALPGMVRLTLDHTPLGDAGLAALVELPKLQFLLLDGTKVSKGFYQATKKKFPKVQMKFVFND